MKKCPKCGADNRPDSSACYNCFSSLVGVADTGAASVPPAPVQPQGTQPMGAVPQQPVTPPSPGPVASGGPLTGGGPLGGGPLTGGQGSDDPVTVVGQPLGGYQNQQPQPPSPYGPPPVRREYPRAPQPVKKGGGGGVIAIILILAILLGGGGFAYWKYVYEPSTPVGVVRAFIKALDNKDIETAKKYIIKSDKSDIESAIMLEPGKGKSIEGVHFTLRLETSDNTTAKVKIKILPPDIGGFKEKLSKDFPPFDPIFRQKLLDAIADVAQKDGMPIVLTKVDGKWKIDSDKIYAEGEKLGREIGIKILMELQQSGRPIPGMPGR